MDGLFDLSIINEGVDHDPDVKEFKEFCTNLNRLGVITNPELYLEAMVDNNKSFTDKFKLEPPLKNTRKTTKDIKKAYNDVTDGGGSLIRSVWDMSMKAIQLSSRIIKFVLMNLAKVPKMLVGLAQTIGRIPQNVRNKVRGNINLYITVNDVNNLFKTLVPVIDDFLAASNEMSKGDMWGTFFNRRSLGSNIVTKYILTENDMSYYKKMKSAYERLKLIEFKETVIRLEDQNVVDIYFGGTKSIKYTNANNKTIESNYYDGLVAIFNDIKEQEDFLKQVQVDMSEKFDKSQMNQAYARLGDSAQKTVGEAIQMIAKVINIIGNLIRYVIADIKTLRNSAQKILKSNEVRRVKNESVDHTNISYDELRATCESFDASCEEMFGESFDTLYDECFGLFEERGAKVDEKTKRSLTPEEKKIADERFGEIKCSIFHDKNGYFATTHRARTKFYPTLEELPKGKVKFISSTS